MDGRGLPGVPAAGIVLVADDHAAQSQAIQRLLEARGLSARWAPDGARAVAMVAES